MSRFKERDEQIVRDYLNNVPTIDIARREGLTCARIWQIVARDAPVASRWMIVLARKRDVAVLGLKRSRETRMAAQIECARNRAVEEWLESGLTYSEAARKASAEFFETTRSAVAGIAHRQRRRAA